MASTIFRKGVIYDALVGLDWVSIKEINRKVGGTITSTNKACLVMFNDKVLEKNGRCELRLRKYRLRDGVERPKDGRGAPLGVVRCRTDRRDGTLSWNYAKTELEACWGVFPMATFTLDYASLDTRVPEVPAEQSQAAE